MKKILTVSAVTALVIAPFGANAFMGVDLYMGANAGIGVQYGNDRSFNATSYGAMVGIDIPVVRIEAEYNYLTGDKKGHELDIHAAMANLYFKLLPTPIIKPYFGLGIGSLFSGEIDSIDIDTKMAYQGMLGLQFDIPATPLLIDIEARCMFAFDVLPESARGQNFTNTDVRLKLRYQF